MPALVMGVNYKPLDLCILQAVAHIIWIITTQDLQFFCIWITNDLMETLRTL